MKVLIAILVLLIVLVAIGWIGFSRKSGNPAIEFNADKASGDVKSMVEKVGDAVSSEPNESSELNEGPPK